MRKFLGLVLTGILLFCTIFSIVGCGEETGNSFQQEEIGIEEYREKATVEAKDYYAIQGELYLPEKGLLEREISLYTLNVAKANEKEEIDFLTKTLKGKIDSVIRLEKLVLGETTQKEIAKDFNEQYNNPLYFDAYYGNYNGYEAFLRTSDTDRVKDVLLAGEIFRYGYEWEIILWGDGGFLSIEEAYAKNLIKAEDVKVIAYYHALFVKRDWQGTDSEFENWYYNIDDIR